MKNQPCFPLTSRELDEVIAIGPSGPVRVDQFLNEAIALSRQLPAKSYVINLITDRYQYLLGFCAAIIAGQCTLMPSNKLQVTLALLGEMYPDSYTLDERMLADCEVSPIGKSGAPLGETNPAIPEIPAEQLCAIAFTSGSTGAPSPNLKYWETFRTGALGSSELLAGEVSSRLNMLATVPAQHMWGLETYILIPLFANKAISHLSPFYPQDIADGLESLPGPRALISSPVHLDVLYRSEVRLVKLDWIFSATAPLSEILARKLEAKYKAKVVEIFGCTESGILASRKTATEKLWRLAAHFKLEPGKDGVSIRAAHLPETVSLPDVVELVGDHQFRWLGRQQDMIKIAGKRGSLADLNRRLASIPGVIDGIIFVSESEADRLAAMVVAPKLKASDILEALKSQVEPVFLPRPVYFVSALPRQETGKISRKAVLELFEETGRMHKSNKPL